jgi:uncharacterized protein YkwD
MIRNALIALAIALPLAAQTHTEITRSSVIASMNERRVAQGLAPLHEDPRLDAAAEARVADMLELAYWGHQSPDGRSPFLLLKPNGYNFAAAGENLAAGFETAEVLIEGWMESPGHRDNILSTMYSDCGVAIIDGSTKGRAAGKSIVVMFARPLVAPVEEPPVRRQAYQHPVRVPIE